MKCLLCDFRNNNLEELKKHYLNFQQVDRDNRFFKKLFEEQQNNVFYGKQCVRCKEFLPTAKAKSRYDFLKHYEEKPIAITTVGPIKIYEINFQNHSSDYEFFNSEQTVDEFLFNVKNRIQ